MRFLGSRKNQHYDDGDDEEYNRQGAVLMMDDEEDDSSYGPAPPPPPPVSDDDDLQMPGKDDPPLHKEEDVYEQQRDRRVMQSEDDDEDDEDDEEYDDYDDEQSLEIPPTSIVQRMVENEAASKSNPGCMLIALTCCCLIVLAAILGAGFGTGAFLTNNSNKNASTRSFDSARADAIRGILQNESTAPDNRFDDTASAESKAVSWLGTEPAFAGLGTESAGDLLRLQQLYSLGLLWYSSTEPWENDDGWLQTDDECSWYGVSCQQVQHNGDTVNAVTGIDLGFNNFRGTLPGDIAMLPYLQELDLSDSEIAQDISTIDWSQMAGRLVALRLGGNDFSGDLSLIAAVGESLQELVVSENQFGGALPDLRALANLRLLDVEANRFGGPLPAFLGALANLETLRLGYNNWSQGPMPTFLYTMRNLQELSLRRANLTGNLQAAIQSLKELKTLLIEDNAFTGMLPATLFSGLPALEEFGGQGNFFTGPIPELTSQNGGNPLPLAYLDLTANDLTGQVPDLSAVQGTLKSLRLGNNGLTGPMPGAVPQLIQLEELDLSRNSMSGALPFNIGGLFNLRTLNLSANLKPEGTGFFGPLPASLGNLRKLRRLELRSNLFTGEIPATLANLESIKRVDLRFNMVNGVISDDMGAAWSDTLHEGYFGNTQLEGPIPDSICGPVISVLEASCTLECSCCTMEC